MELMAYYYWWKKVVGFPVHYLCRAFATRFGLRKTGLLMLSQEVEACEYEDVHIMWDMLRKTETTASSQDDVARSSKLLKINRPHFQIKLFAKIRSCYMP